VQRERAPQRQLVRRPADPDPDLARLDDPLAGPAGKRRPVGVHRERDLPPLAGFQRHPGEPGQPPHRPHHRGDRVAEVELDDLGPRSRSRVRHAARDLRRSVRRHAIRRDRQVRVRKGRVRQPVPEREQRGRVHRAAVVLAGQPGPQVGRWRGGRAGGHLDRQLPARHNPPGQHAGDRRTPLLAREEGLHDPGQPGGHRAQRVRPPGNQDRDDRDPGAGQGGQQVLLHPRQPQVGRVAALTGGAAPEQPRLVPDHGDHDVRGLRGGDRRGEPRGVSGPHRAARHVSHSSRPFTSQRVQHGSNRHARRGLRMRLAQVPGHAVAAEERQRVIGQRPDHGHPGVRPHRERTVPVGQ